MFALRTFVRRVSTERSINKVTLIGRAGNNPVVKGNEEHPAVLFSLATNTGMKVDWHRIVVFKEGLRNITTQFVKPGSRLYIEGKIGYMPISDSDGRPQQLTSIIADQIVFLGSRSNNSEANSYDQVNEATSVE